ncbi:MAG TPA: MFS transporter [Candidatus Limnocylindrales bacterium]|nr:MFS transporter [Candidatus Limnocylindrales bacterium]
MRHDRDYRWLWTGQAIGGMGNQITRLALPFQVYALTGSTLAIAALTAVQLVPILAFALAAGSLADSVDRRKLLLATQIGLMACSAALVGLAVAGEPALPVLFAVAFVGAGLSAVDQPARSSSIARLVPPERLPAALALNQLNNQAASIVGPAVAGILIATVGLVGAYAVDVVSFVATLVAVLALRPLPPLEAAGRPGLKAIREGLAFVRSRRAILGSFVIDLDAMILAMPTSLFPAIALDVFRVGPAGLGLLASAPAAGAFLAAIFSGWVGRVVRIGRAVFGCVIAWGLTMAAFGAATVVQELVVTPSTAIFAVALAMLALAGAADMLSAVFRNTIVQLGAPDALRGRVMSIHTLVVTSGPRVGDIQSAVVASIIGPGQAVVVGGLACVAGAGIVARTIPELGAHVIRRVRPAD